MRYGGSVRWGISFLTGYIGIGTLFFLLLSTTAHGQVQSFGSTAGGTIMTPSLRSNPVASQYGLFLSHRINRTLSGEVNGALRFLAHPLRRTRLYDLDYRFRLGIKPLFGGDTYADRFTPYLYAGLGAARYQHLEVDVQPDSKLRESDVITNSSLWSNGSGWALQVPLGLGAEFRLDEQVSLKATAGYQIFSGPSVIRPNVKREGVLGASLGLSIRPFGGRRNPRPLRTPARSYYELQVRSLPVSMAPPVVLPKTPAAPAVKPILEYRSLPPLYYSTLGYRWKQADEKVLETAARVLKADPALQLRVLGYADPRSNAVMNLTLSNLRSRQAARYFIKEGIAPSRVQVIGYGEAFSANNKELAAYRRIDLQFHYEASGPKEEIYTTLPPIHAPEGKGWLVPPSELTFAPYSDRLTARARHWLQGLTAFLDEHPQYHLKISGPGDPEVHPAVSQMLQAARASAVEYYLINRNISPDRLHTTGSPEEGPSTFQGVRIQGYLPTPGEH